MGLFGYATKSTKSGVIYREIKFTDSYYSIIYCFNFQSLLYKNILQSDFNHSWMNKECTKCVLWTSLQCDLIWDIH